MGTLRMFNLAPFIETCGVRVLVETGTGDGDAMRYARLFRLEKLYSVEIHPELAKHARAAIGNDPRVEVICDESPAALARILPLIPPSTPILFWLDAHFPGADYGLGEYDADDNVDRRMPLARELEVIAKLRHGCDDVLIIDDLRLYEDGQFGQGPCPKEAMPPVELRNTEWLRPFRETHNVRRVYAHTGYLVLTPKRLTADVLPEAA